MQAPGDRSIGTRDALILFAIVFVGLCLRLHGLGRESLWYDEAFTFQFARQSFGEMNRLLVHYVWDPPVYPWMVWVWTRLVGTGDWQVRLLSAIYGTFSILVLHNLVRALFDLRTAHVAAFLAATSQFLIAYSQEARCYAVLIYLLLVTFRAFVRALGEPESPRRWIAFGVLGAVSTLTHYYSLFPLLGVTLFALWWRGGGKVPARNFALALLAFGLLLAPWLATGVIAGATRDRVAQFSYVAPWFAVDKWTFIRTMNDFHGGRMEGLINPAPRWTFPIGALLLGIPALAALFPRAARRAERPQIAFLALVWLVPMACLIALGFARIQFATRYVLYAAPPYLVLAARGLAVFRTPWRTAFLAAIALWSVLGVAALQKFPRKEDYRSAFEMVAVESRQGDGLLFLPFGVLPLEWPVYHPDQPKPRVIALDDVETADCERLWVFEYRRVRDDNEASWRARAALNRHFHKVRESRFFLIRAELWVRTDAGALAAGPGNR